MDLPKAIEFRVSNSPQNLLQKIQGLIQAEKDRDLHTTACLGLSAKFPTAKSTRHEIPNPPSAVYGHEQRSVPAFSFALRFLYALYLTEIGQVAKALQLVNMVTERLPKKEGNLLVDMVYSLQKRLLGSGAAPMEKKMSKGFLPTLWPFKEKRDSESEPSPKPKQVWQTDNGPPGPLCTPPPPLHRHCTSPRLTRLCWPPRAPGHKPVAAPFASDAPLHRAVQECIRREGTSEVAPEAVRHAVGGGCQSGRGRLLSVTNAIEPGGCRQGDSSWA